ncbi:hypothetical protein [Gloeocapsopsis crepidinum]|uniref:hypothetical protein n=1 Tax=Gloeocapsopsis crepidinum TaxID=693223 RepID=UPI001D14B394|nr:hypothetical protein [Gloeocapsopsis crepidinum]
MSNTLSNLEAFWMPFTANRQFKEKPRFLVAVEGMYYTSDNGRQILDIQLGCGVLMLSIVVKKLQQLSPIK